MRARSLFLSMTFGLGVAVAASSALAVPKQIVILRHGEKYSAYELCKTGVERSQALLGKYLGRGAQDSLFPGIGPTAFYAITLHSLELVSPTAISWGLPVIGYTVVPPFKNDSDEEVALNLRTQQAAADVLNNPAWNGKVVVMVWEHKHIAHKDLNKQSPPVTLRELLNLDKLTGANQVPETWEGDNYDYFWIVNFEGSTTPVSFVAQKQTFSGKYKDVPSDDWGKKENPKPTGCK